MKKVINLDPGTFENTPAAKILVEILSKEENQHLLRKVSRMLATFGLFLNELEKTDTKARLSFGSLVYDSFILSASSLPPEVKTFTSNVISTRYKKWLIKNDGRTPKKNRILKNL